MSLKRVQRINQLMKEEVGQLLLREIDFPRSFFVTITRVETSPGLRESRIFISIWPAGNEKVILNILDKKIYFLQQKINKRLKMRPIPKISFFEEEKTKEAGRIEEILERLKKEEK